MQFINVKSLQVVWKLLEDVLEKMRAPNEDSKSIKKLAWYN